MTRIDVIRHGEPVGGRCYRGHGIDDPLTETGWQQMWASVPEPCPWQAIISSPLLRCAEFAAALAERNQIEYTIIDALKEIGFGEWEGKTPDEINAAQPGALERFSADPVHNRPTGAESLDDFSDRVWRVYQDTAERYQNQHVLIVAHSGVARAIIANVVQMPLHDVYGRFKVEYGAVVSTLIEKPAGPAKLLIAQ